MEAAENERLAILSLWAIPGIGPQALAALETEHGALASLLDRPPLEVLPVTVADSVLPWLGRVERLRQLGEWVWRQARAAKMLISFEGDPGYPDLMNGMPDAPPLLFHFGTPKPGFRPVAFVGTRNPGAEIFKRAQKLGVEAARRRLLVVSGGARGIDRACHEGAIEASAPTWMFVGSALDELDSAQQELVAPILEKGGAVYSELPPGVRASKQTFPRRNRLITGASCALVIIRADEQSGCRHTARAALGQKRPVLVMMGDPQEPGLELGRYLLREDLARACGGIGDIVHAIGVEDLPEDTPAVVDLGALSEEARQAYQAMPHQAVSFEQVLVTTRFSAARLTSALCELELSGLVVQYPGKQYERI